MSGFQGEVAGGIRLVQKIFSEFEETLRLFIIAAACIGAVLTSVFSLTHTITEVFPFLYILPIILVVYFYPKRAVLFTLFLSLMYISLIILLGSTNPSLMIIATAWFAIFMTIGVVASSYANELVDEKSRIRNILQNSQDGIFCFSFRTGQLLGVNAKCAQWLKFDRSEIVGKDLSAIWTDPDERKRFIDLVKKESSRILETEALFRARDGTVLRFVVSALLITRDRALCSAIDITGEKIADEEIRRTLDDLEEQVKARTAHLERINEELKAEILERRRFESSILSDTRSSAQDQEERA
jgi:PAS domain S-box-containing protein